MRLVGRVRVRDLQVLDGHEHRNHDGGRVAGTVTGRGVISDRLFGQPGYLVSKHIQQALRDAHVVRHHHATILLEQKGTKAGTGGHHAFGRVDDVHVMQEGDIQDVILDAAA